jgi:osmotically-inducible protein OsmY
MKGQQGESCGDPNVLQVSTELEAHIFDRVGRQVYDFRLVVMEGELILRGRARTYYAKQLAQHAVMKVTRVPIRANEIQVQPNEYDHDQSDR